MTDKLGARPSGSGSRASHRAAKASRPEASIPRAKKEWHLVCITRLGKVSMIRDLDLRTARETYQRLLPDQHPKKHVFPDCKECGKGGWSWYGGGGRSYGPHDDWLEKVEVIGPAGRELDPWHGVEPRIINMSYLCRCPKKPEPKAEPKWDANRTDFWNNPKLWDSIDPAARKCWMPEDVQ